MTKHISELLPAVLAGLLLAEMTSFAQRTAEGSTLVGVSQGITLGTHPSGALSLEAGKYFRDGFWSIGGAATSQIILSKDIEGCFTDMTFDRERFTLQGRMNYRLVHSYNRRAALYLGAGAFAGASTTEIFRPLPKEMVSDLPKSEFVYGLAPSVEMEFFPSQSTAITLKIESPCVFGSGGTSAYTDVIVSLGLRYNIK